MGQRWAASLRMKAVKGIEVQTRMCIWSLCQLSGEPWTHQPSTSHLLNRVNPNPPEMFKNVQICSEGKHWLGDANQSLHHAYFPTCPPLIEPCSPIRTSPDSSQLLRSRKKSSEILGNLEESRMATTGKIPEPTWKVGEHQGREAAIEFLLDQALC